MIEAIVSGVIIGSIMTVMFYITAPLMTKRFMKGANIEGHTSKAVKALEKIVDEKIARIMENDMPHALGAVIQNEKHAIYQTALHEAIPAILKSPAVEEFVGNVSETLKTDIQSAIGGSLSSIGGKVLSERSIASKQDKAQEKQMFMAMLDSKFPGASMIVDNLKKSTGIDLVKMGMDNPQAAMALIDKFTKGGGLGGSGQQTGGIGL